MGCMLADTFAAAVARVDQTTMTTPPDDNDCRICERREFWADVVEDLTFYGMVCMAMCMFLGGPALLVVLYWAVFAGDASYWAKFCGLTIVAVVCFMLGVAHGERRGRDEFN